MCKATVFKWGERGERTAKEGRGEKGKESNNEIVLAKNAKYLSGCFIFLIDGSSSAGKEQHVFVANMYIDVKPKK